MPDAFEYIGIAKIVAIGTLVPPPPPGTSAVIRASTDENDPFGFGPSSYQILFS